MAGQGVDAGGDGHGRPARGQFLQDLEVDLVRLAPAAVLLGVREAEQPRLAEGREEPFGIGLGGLVLVHPRRELLVGDLPGEGDEVRRLGGGKQAVDIHGDSSGAQSGTGEGTPVPFRVAQEVAAATPGAAPPGTAPPGRGLEYWPGDRDLRRRHPAADGPGSGAPLRPLRGARHPPRRRGLRPPDARRPRRPAALLEADPVRPGRQQGAAGPGGGRALLPARHDPGSVSYTHL